MVCLGSGCSSPPPGVAWTAMDRFPGGEGRGDGKRAQSDHEPEDLEALWLDKIMARHGLKFFPPLDQNGSLKRKLNSVMEK